MEKKVIGISGNYFLSLSGFVYQQHPPEHALMWSGCSPPPPRTVHTAAPSSESGQSGAQLQWGGR